MTEVKLGQLPASLADTLRQGRFLVAYYLPAADRYIAWYILPSGRREELEYDVSLGRCLTADERREELPPASRAVLADEDVTTTTSYFIDGETYHLCVKFDAVDGYGNQLPSIIKSVHVPRPWDGEELVRQALKRQRFPASYAAWPREQKITHWAAVLHRFRRAQGESGRDEDEIYTQDMVRDMERTDPRVRELLPDILTQVGLLEQTPPEEAIAAFSSRTGIPVARPKPYY